MPPTGQHAPASIEHYLVDRLAAYLKIPAETIRSDTPMADYGLDSVYAVAISLDIEDTFQIAVEPTLLWDFDTLADLTSYLAGLVTRAVPN